MSTKFTVPVSALSPIIDSQLIQEVLSTENTEKIQFIGQQRAQTALDFGLSMEAPGYHLYVMGEPTLGRHTLIQNCLQPIAQQKKPASVWCYINNFENGQQPKVLRLKPEHAHNLMQQLENFIDELLITFPVAFDNPGYQRQKKLIDRAFNQKYDQALAKVEQISLSKNVALFQDSNTVSFAPIVDGKPIDDTEFTKLTDEQRKYFYDLINELESLLNEQLLELPQWRREAAENIKNLKQDTIEQAIKPLFKTLDREFASELGILKYFKEFKPELIDSIARLFTDDGETDNKEDIDKKGLFIDLLMPNILVDQQQDVGAPIIYEPNPTYQNLFGRIEYASQLGATYTNYRMIKPGALHQANGGYLILEVEKLLNSHYVWDALKLALKQRCIRIENPFQESSTSYSTGLTPQDIPLDIKLILIGSRDLYYSLQEYDEEFNELCRVLVDFDYAIQARKTIIHQFIKKIQQHVEKSENIEQLTIGSIERLLWYSYRQAEHQQKLSAHFIEIIDLVNEAAYYQQQKQETLLNTKSIEYALNAREYRSSRMRESILEDIKEGQILIATSGDAIGKVNGLTILEIGDTAFGSPSRISATVYPGSNGIVDIEREVDLGKSIHSKGVMLLTGYLGQKYATNFPLTLSANIAIEQSYGHIDGDSASLAEICALLSAITYIPLKQSIAVTGSINQHGEVQSVGGVNEKIEGFFELCQQRGFNQQQGVIIPKSNLINLVLKPKVITAINRGQFTLYCVDTVDEALIILTGLTVGQWDTKTGYTKESFNDVTVKRLRTLAEIVNGSNDDEQHTTTETEK